MERSRTIAAAPLRTASDAWQLVVNLLADTLERSSSVPEGSVAEALAPLNGLGPALIAAGHLERTPLVLSDAELHLGVTVVTGDAALAIEENLNPVPGGGQATGEWVLHLPPCGPLSEAVEAAAARSNHLTTEDVASKAAGVAKATPVDLDAVRRYGDLA